MMHIFYSPVQRTHVITHEITGGRRVPHNERVSRVDSILKELRKEGLYEIHSPPELPPEALLACHDADYIAFLKRSHDLAPDDLIWPHVFPMDARLVKPKIVPIQQAGWYSFDVETPIMRQTWKAAQSSASAAYAAAIHMQMTGGVSYALCRPPGHHATRNQFGGYCYLNNAAVAAAHLAQFGKVLIVDFDYHHGNGTQSIFYDRSDVYYLSIHGHPEVEYPFFCGWDHERGIDEGDGFNLNIPLMPRTPVPTFFESLQQGLQICHKTFAPDFLVLSAGFDIENNDPVGHFNLNTEDFEKLGRLFRSLKLRTTVVQEGGYLVEMLGKNVAAFLRGLQGL